MTNSMQTQPYFTDIFHLMLLKLPKDDMKDRMAKTLDIVLKKGEGRFTYKHWNSKKEELIDELHKLYISEGCMVETLLKSRFFRNLTKVKNEKLINKNLYYLEHIFVPRQLYALTNNDEMVKILVCDKFVITFFAHLFSGTNDPEWVASEAQIYHRLPRELADKFFKEQNNILEELDLDLKKEILKKEDLETLILLIKSSEENRVIYLVSAYIDLLAKPLYSSKLSHFSLSIRNFLEKLIKGFKEKAFDLKSTEPLQLLERLSDLGMEQGELCSNITNLSIVQEFLSVRRCLDLVLLYDLKHSKIKPQDVQTINEMLQFKKLNIGWIALQCRYLLGNHQYQSYASILKEGLLQNLQNLLKDLQEKPKTPSTQELEKPLFSTEKY